MHIQAHRCRILRKHRSPTSASARLPCLKNMARSAGVFLGAVLLTQRSGAEAPRHGAASMNSDRTLIMEGFEQGLGSWRRHGPADIAVVEQTPHGGRRCLRITVHPGAKLIWQQAYIEGSEVTPGAMISASAFVRTEGVADGTGAYMYVEFLQGNRRISIVHSRTDRATGAKGWEPLVVEEAPVPRGCTRRRVGLVLHAHGTAWFDDVTVRMHIPPPLEFRGRRREFRIHPDRVVTPAFGGVGFHVFYHLHRFAPDLFDTVLAKRWLELRPSYARVTHRPDWTKEDLDRVAAALAPLRRTHTRIYVTTWGPKDVPAGPERDAYVRQVVDHLEYLIRRKGFAGIHLYCMTNELSLKKWGSLQSDLETFRDYHRRFYLEFRGRGLDVGLLASDAAPISSWWTIQWAADHMDDITAAYGGHHYFNRFPPDNVRFYPWFLEQCRRGVDIARSRNKPFVIGEFGCKQDSRVIDGVKMDACVFWNTPKEPLVGIQLAEAVFAAMNAGVYALCNWTFADFPDEYNRRYKNKWGVFRWSGADHAPRPHYYAYGRLTRCFRAPGAVVAVESNDPLIRGAALRDGDRWAIAVVNRNKTAVEVIFRIDGVRNDIRLARFTYDPAAPPSNPFGDLPGPDGYVTVKNGAFSVQLPAGALVVYTSRIDERPPAPVPRATVRPNEQGVRIEWEASPSRDVIYYRVRRTRTTRIDETAEQIGSTAALHFDVHGAGAARYLVQPVDWDGVAGPAVPAAAQ